MLKIIAGKYKGRRLYTPSSTSTRPTQEILREAVFNICQSYIDGANVLDLYAGSGAIGLEALSRGAAHVTFIESNRGAIACIKKNIQILEVQTQVTLIPMDAKAALSKISKSFDIVYIDPPYDMTAGPILKELEAKTLLNPGAHVFLEERFTPKTTYKPVSNLLLTFVNSRRFGPAILHQYVNRPLA